MGARMVEFAGFEMPVQYSSILREHAAVRDAAGLFDVSHMGQLQLEGPEAVATAERLLTRPVASLRVGRARYGLLCNDQGGTLDDVTFYRTAQDAVFLCVNASNAEKDYRWLVRHAPARAGARNVSERTGMLALQGPASAELMARVAGQEAAQIRRFAFEHREVAGAPALVSRTGYTGSDGFEIYVGAGHVVRVFESILEEGKPLGVVPAGLGARDTLRLEAALPLYGHELDEDTSPLEAGLARFVKLEAGGFIGAEALRRQAADGPPRTLVGFVLEERGVARDGYPILSGNRTVGRVTSGAPSPTLGKSIGLAYVPPDLGEVGTRIGVGIRGRATSARVVETPFVKAG
jgi:aminomethyltransferase